MPQFRRRVAACLRGALISASSVRTLKFGCARAQGRQNHWEQMRRIAPKLRQARNGAETLSADLAGLLDLNISEDQSAGVQDGPVMSHNNTLGWQMLLHSWCPAPSALV
ncbi:hypothetical protein QQF64_015104 [Cirrhinus molitorella]|uniref:Uncharacterized protein n=1 Tax=Cirrhinus molitorella TaxID=172907 RepID=A0ABR3NU89_9TELE